MPTEEKIKLLLVVTKLELGGAQKHVLDLIEGLDKERFELFLFSAGEGYFVEKAAGLTGVTFYRSRFLERSVNPVRDLCALIELAAFIKKNKIGIVHTHSSKAGVLGRMAARIAGVRRIVHTVHGWSFHERQSAAFRWLAILIEKALARWTDTLIVVSCADEHKGRGAGIVPRGTYALVRCSFNAQAFSGSAHQMCRQALGFSEKDIVLGMVACFKPQKAPLDFVKFATAVKEKLPQARFILVGDGVLKEAIMQQIRMAGLGKDFILTGWRQDMPEVLSVMDVFVLTSLWEGLPISVFEAMASRVPVVATDTGGIRDVVIDGKTGFLVEPGDVTGLRDKALHLVRDADLRRSVTEAALMRITDDEFNRDVMCRKIEKIYRQGQEQPLHV
ncbi:MAG: glycosyltransferase family 4 protein [Candidatus Omnitrophica bacterium]|nr:glycosyltransferase family 4 protein [Candidatus Omnitrophota bacterium]